MTASHIDLFTIDDNGQFQLASAGQVIEAALAILDEKVMRNGLISAPADASAFFSLRLGSLEHEVFAAIFLDAQNRVIEYIELFRGTLTQTSVYPREVVKTSLRLNAAAVIFAHFVARHKMRILCPVFLCAVLGGQERTSWASGQNRGT